MIQIIIANVAARCSEMSFFTSLNCLYLAGGLLHLPSAKYFITHIEVYTGKPKKREGGGRVEVQKKESRMHHDPTL